ncbi:PTS transporter subunit EIIB [Peribacillus huizhouensis]|uniref:Glucose-like phosphotransferase system IIB component n=1 Tax=Peribacillus huizhouensis TaxID=1501239 RepID=A0ABR6CWD2_9BACI|nr:PTS transporter subunit EIIB [Peribacillus huizhouensis]MBA9029343.1 glucose-like phosphotransferase system IIB component [Peribacillus huizhouensis]
MVVGLVIAAVYYFVFRFAITKWNLATRGREKEEENKTENAELIATAGSLSEKVLITFGGKDNITELNACMSRLRITVKDKKIVDKVGSSH